MPSSELLNDLTSEPISRRAVAAGLWAAPVIALTVAAPAVAASHATLEVTGSGSGSNRVWTVTFSNLASGSTIIVRANQSNKSVRFTGGSGTATPTTAAQQFVVSGAVSGSFTFVGESSPVGTVTAGTLSRNFS